MSFKQYTIIVFFLQHVSHLTVKASLSAVSPSVSWDLASLPIFERPLVDWGGIPYSALFNGVTNITNITSEFDFTLFKCRHFQNLSPRGRYEESFQIIRAANPTNSSWFRFVNNQTENLIILTRNNIPLESSSENFELTILASDSTGQANVSVAAFQSVPLVPREYPATNASLPLSVQSSPQTNTWFTRNFPPDQFYNVGNYSSRSNVRILFFLPYKFANLGSLAILLTAQH